MGCARVGVADHAGERRGCAPESGRNLTVAATPRRSSQVALRGCRGDFRRIHRMGIIARHYRAAEGRHKEIELAAHELLQYLDAATA